MSSPRKNKKLILSLLLIVLIIAGVFGVGHGALAEEKSTAGNAILQQALGSQSWWFGLMLTIVIALQAIFSWLIIFASMLLNVAFNMNLGLVPSALQVVQTGWIVLRDLVNGVFILLVLWIALTIILGIEQYGGKRLLAKILAVAVLINFSLAIVTAIVAFSNQFALAFSRSMGGADKDPAGFFITTLHINTTTNQLSPDKAKALADAKEKSEFCKKAKRDPLLQNTIGASDMCNDSIGAALVNAGLKAYQASQKVSEWSTTELNLVVQGAIGLIIIFVVTSVFLYGAIALLIRYFAILLLTIASPIAFITVALPLNLGKSEGWDYWWREFMKWVFFAPAFYFLMYLAMLMATQYKNAFQAPNGLSVINVDGQYIFAMVIVLGLLVYASRFAKKTSGKMGEVTVGLGKKLTGLAVGVTAGVATGGTLMAARGLARRAVKPGTRTERVVRAVAGVRGLGQVTGARALQRAGTGLLAEREKEIEERKKNYTHLSKDTALAQYRGSLGRVGFDGRNNAAMLSMFADKGWLKDLDKPGERERAAQIMSRYGMASKITKADPTIATIQTLTNADKDKIRDNEKKNVASGNNKASATDPVRYVAQGLTGDEIKNINTDGIKKDDAAGKAAREGILRNNNLNTQRLRDIIQKDILAGQKLVDHMDNMFWTQLNVDIASEQDVQIKAGLEATKARLESVQRYLGTTTGRALGIRTPANWPRGGGIVDLGEEEGEEGGGQGGGVNPPISTTGGGEVNPLTGAS